MLTLSCYWKRVLCMVSFVFGISCLMVAAEPESDLAICDLVVSVSSRKNLVQCISVNSTDIPEDFQCSICLGQEKTRLNDAEMLSLLFEIVDPLQILKTTCKHYFHRRCLLQWLRSGTFTCPVCRAEISKGTK